MYRQIFVFLQLFVKAADRQIGHSAVRGRGRWIAEEPRLQFLRFRTSHQPSDPKNQEHLTFIGFPRVLTVQKPRKTSRDVTKAVTLKKTLKVAHSDLSGADRSF